MRADADPDAPGEDLGATLVLVQRARGGAQEAQAELLRIFEPRVRRLLSARLPRGARGLMDTQDLVQEVFLRAFRGLDTFDARGAGSFWIWIRGIATNQLRDQGRRVSRRGVPEPLATQTGLHPAGDGPAPPEQSIGEEESERFDFALQRVAERERTAVVMRLELEAPYEAIASELGYPSPDAARMAVKRALQRIAEELGHGAA